MHLLSFPRVYAVFLFFFFFLTLISVSKTTFFNAHPPIIYHAYPALWDITWVGWRRDSCLRVPTQTPGWNLCHSGANHCTILPPMMKYLAQSDDDVHFFCAKISVYRHRLYWIATITDIFQWRTSDKRYAVHFHFARLRLVLNPFADIQSSPSSTPIIPSAGDVSQPYTSFLLWKVRGGVNIWVRQRSREAEGSRISSRRHVGLISRSWPLLSCHHVIAGPRLC